jgi:beta-propeller repeat-containing protein
VKKNSRGAVVGASVILACLAAFGCSPADPSGPGGGATTTSTTTGVAVCTPGATESCYDGPPGTEGVGICKAGTHTCMDDGSGFEACMDQVEPQNEKCDTPEDEDCDGASPSELPGCCAPGAIVGCYSGPPTTKWVGICKPGTKICNEAGSAFSPCVGEILPQIESCDTPFDDDCDGSVSDGEINCCKEGDTRSCYDGPPGTAGMGICVGGTQVCNGNGSGFGPCMGQVLPQAEQCNTTDDESCDGSSACTGAFAWAKRFGNKTQTGTAAVDKSGNIALIGSFDETTDLGGGILTSAGGTDVYLAKLTSAGAPIFSKRFGNLSSQQGNAVAFDIDGNIYLAGSFQGTIDFGGGALTSAGSDDVYLAKLDPKGKQIWARQFGGSSSEAALYLGVDKLGNVYASGTFSGSVDFGGGLLTSTGGNDIFVLALDEFGQHLWSKRAGDVGSDLIGSMAVDPDGSVYLTGRFAYSIDFGSGSITSAGGDDLFAVKLDQFGDPQWSEGAGDLSGQSGTAVAVNVLGDVFLGGDFQGSIDLGQGTMVSAGASDVFLARLDSSGFPVWAQSFGDTADQHLTSLAVDASGNVTVTGQFQGTIDFGDGPHTSAGGNDIFVAKLDASGVPLWSKTFGDVSFAQSGKSISADPSGGVIVAGVFGGTVDFGGGSLICKGTSNAFVARLQP